MTQELEYHKLPSKAADIYRRLGVKFVCDGQTGGGPQGSIPNEASGGAYNRENDVIHFPKSGPRDLRVAMHELGHWTGGPQPKGRMREFGIDEHTLSMTEAWKTGTSKEKADLLIELISDLMDGGAVQYAAEEIIAETCSFHLQDKLGAPADASVMEDYLSHYTPPPTMPDHWFNKLVPVLKSIGRSMADLLVEQAYKVEDVR